MIRRIIACKCVRPLLNIFKLIQACFNESSMMMKDRFLNTIRKPSTRAVSLNLQRRRDRRQITIKVKSQNHVDHIFQYEGHSFWKILGTEESCGRTNHGRFSIIMHLLTTPWTSSCSWLRGISPYWNNFPIYLILFRVIFFFTPNSRESLRGPVLQAWSLSRGP